MIAVVRQNNNNVVGSLEKVSAMYCYGQDQVGGAPHHLRGFPLTGLGGHRGAYVDRSLSDAFYVTVNPPLGKEVSQGFNELLRH